MEEMDATSIPTQLPEGDSDAPQLGFLGKLWNLFVDPKKTFASVGRNHEWVILWILASLISIGSFMPIKAIVKEARLDQVEEYLEAQNVPEERREEFRDGVRRQFDDPKYLLFVPATLLVALLIVSGILLFLGNIILGGDTSYLRMLNAYAWTGLIVIPATIVTIPLVMAKGSMDVSIGLGVLTSADTGPFLKKLLSSFELFALWQVWLSSVAVGVLAGVQTSKAFWAVFVIWLIWVMAQSGLAALGIPLGM